MKKLLLMAVAIIALAACNKNEETAEAISSRTFTFHLSADLLRSYSDVTRSATALAQGSEVVTDLWALDYYNGRLEQVVHQVSTEAGFGKVEMPLQYGSHDVRLVASKGTEPLLTASSLSWAKVMDTFAAECSVEVEASADDNRSVVMERIIGGVRVVMLDAVPVGAATVDVVWQKSMSLALPYLDVATAQEQTQTLSFPQPYIGKAGKEFSVYTLMGNEPLTTDIQLTFRRANNSVISSFTIPDIEIRRNRMTVLRGECFNRTGGFTVSVNDVWEEDYSKDF